MLTQLQNLVEQSAQRQVVENQSIPNQLNGAVIREVSTQIFNGMKEEVVKGRIQEIVTMFHSPEKKIGSHPLVTSIVSSASSSLTEKFGISAQDSQKVASSLVPEVVNQVVKRSKDPRDIDFDLQQMIRGMSGNQSLDISKMMPQEQKSALGGMFGKLFKK